MPEYANLMAIETRSQSIAPENRHGLAGLVGASPKMQRVYDLILKVAPRRHPVLVLGESGVGKELVARAIYAFGPWRDEPFVAIDCGALSPTLVESELFGHVRGAFTGANHNRTGLLALAGRGTVFLDEIAEMPSELQAKLLRALQEREIRPIGSNARLPLDARIVAGTNQDLDAAMARGAFRKDLFFRLNVVTLRLPPLRERKSDIPALVSHFFERFRRADSPVRKISSEATASMMTYDWPGNVRELENAVQRAMTLCAGPEIHVNDLPSSVQNSAMDPIAKRRFGTLEAMERQAIREALDAAGGDRLRAARMLGIGKSTIYRKLKRYGINEKDSTRA